MSPADFRAAGHAMVDFIAAYWESLQREPDKFAVQSRAAPGDILALLPSAPPQHGDADTRRLLADIERIVMPGVTHWQHPHFYGYFPANVSGPSVLGELLSAGLGVQGMLWATSPACTEVETRVLDWLAQMIALPSEFHSTSDNGGGVIQGTASDAALVAMVAARERVLRLGRGLPGPAHELVAYASTQAHSSIIKAAMIAGVATGPDDRVHVRLINADEQFRMRPEALEAAMREDSAAGRTPFFVCTTVGTTGCTAIDPVDGIAAAMARAGTAHSSRAPASERRGTGAWLHVDAAHAGAACVCPEFQHWLAGVEHADSVCFNPHKWLLTNFDCDCFWTRDRRALTRALSITPEYLRNAASDGGTVIDYRDWQVPLGRRFRALKLWFVIRHYGVEGLREHVRGHMRAAETLESLVRADERFELAAPRTMNLVCFRLRLRGDEAGGVRSANADALNKALMDALNAGGKMFLTHTTLPTSAASGGPSGTSRAAPIHDAFTLRMAVGGTLTTEAHVREAWGWVREEATRVLGALPA